MYAQYFYLILLATFSAECIADDYQFISEMNGYLKLHRFPEKWQFARVRCHLEGGILAFPTNPKEVSAMKEIMVKAGLDTIYTGIHATYSNGDFTTLTGIPLSKLNLEWEVGEPTNFENKQGAVTMNRLGALVNLNGEAEHPFMCFKSAEKLYMHKCHPEWLHSDYKFDNRTGSCYKFHKEYRSWSDAFKTCMAEDAYLAIINSDLESTLIQQLFEQYPHSAIHGGSYKDVASIGFSMWREIGRGEWFTVHGESLAEAGFSTFNAGEPNNYNECCGSVWRTGLLNDHNCGTPLFFICEKSPSHDEENENEYMNIIHKH